MSVPNSWKVQKRSSVESKKSTKRQRTSKASTLFDAHPPHTSTHEDYYEVDDVLDNVKNILCNNSDISMDVDQNICTDTVLSQIPYKQIIEDIYENCPTNMANIPLITKAYEEHMMRECNSSSEKQCAMGEECECMKIDPSNKFIGTEFLLPGELTCDTPSLCVLCQRQITQKCFFEVMYDGKNFPFPIQKYGSICGVEGEYAADVMLFCPPNGPLHLMPYPSVSHHRNRYSIVSSYGARHIQQSRVKFEEYPATVPLPPPPPCRVHLRALDTD